MLWLRCISLCYNTNPVMDCLKVDPFFSRTALCRSLRLGISKLPATSGRNERTWAGHGSLGKGQKTEEENQGMTSLSTVVLNVLYWSELHAQLLPFLRTHLKIEPDNWIGAARRFNDVLANCDWLKAYYEPKTISWYKIFCLGKWRHFLRIQ